MRKKDNFNLAAFLRSTLLGIAFTAFFTAGILKYIGTYYASELTESVFSDENKNANNGVWIEDTSLLAENTGADTLPETDTPQGSEPVFIHTLSPEELELQPETDITYELEAKKVSLTEDDLKQLKDINYLKRNFYTIDHRTDLLASDVDVDEFLNMDLSIAKDSGPKILITHTHSCEMYADSDASKGVSEGIWGVGEELKNILENKYGINVMHDTGRYDVVDGRNQILGAYERMEPAVTKILQENPSIEVVIDMHRDGVNEDVRLVDDVNGKTCAKIMFFNGLCRLNENGSLNNIDSLPNPYLRDNLAFSFNMQVTANKLYPDFTRKIYLNAYRYSLNMKPKSLLIEVGAQTNTKQEAKNSMEPLADILSRVILAE
ncbi:stage II sporulation protein P [Lachnospiraceae bacterium NSJ-143]|nr:stage II sporulation protein P [Lachnospiraceae bacterium NSJ-143]